MFKLISFFDNAIYWSIYPPSKQVFLYVSRLFAKAECNTFLSRHVVNSFESIENKHYLQALVEIANLAKIVEELVYPGLVVFDKGVESHHVSLLGVGRLVGQVLEQLGNL